IKRYVQENGRGLLFTSGDNIYDYDNEGFIDSPINDILPVELKVDEEKETVAMVFVIDLSSSMKEKMGSQTRYQIVLDSAKKVIMESNFAPEDYVGVVVFDQDYHVALEIQPIGDETNRETICETMEYEIEHYYYSHYIDTRTGKDSDFRINPNDEQFQQNGKTYLKVDGEGARYQLPTNYDYKRGGQDKVTGDYIKSYGTSYKWAIQEASAMLGRASNITSIEIKQVIFMSDGAPNDKGSGYEGIVERMAKGGTVTSSIAIGISKSDATAIAELEKISVAGKGEIFLVNDADELKEDLTEIAESIQGKLLNTDITVLPMRDSLNSIVHEGVREYDEIHGYYGTTIKEGAERVIYVDNLRPLYAEWECGLGKVCALMTDLGNVDWTGEMFDDTDGIENVRLVSNILLSPIYKRIDSTGLDYTVTRDDNRIDMTVITPVNLRTQEFNGETLEEAIRASVYKFDQTKRIWVAHGTYHATPLANCKYQVTIPTGSIEETYVIVLDLYKAQIGYNSAGSKQYVAIDYATHADDPLRDTTALAVVGKTLEEYDILRGDQSHGRDLLEGLVTSKTDGLINGNEFNLDDAFRKEEGDEKTITEEYNIDIPLIALALALFVLDIIFRNFVIKKKTKKTGYKTDAEVYESMRGR
ncbi:MAG: VWA domain-containing protein, partial [Clostridia bacterium]|nr:VWA domain-containing protein [Clostridia bacterium]